jgi:non-heme chloroperoxidase
MRHADAERTMIRPLTLLAALALLWAAPAAAAPRERFVDTAPGVRIRVVEFQPPTARPTVVLVPGWLATAEIWAGTAAALGPGQGVIAIDPRSQGESSKVTQNNTPEARAGDLRAIIAQLGLKDVVLVGWSQGVQDVAAYVAGHGPDGVAGVVLVDAAVSRGARGIPADPEAAASVLGLLSIYVRAPEAYAQGMMAAISKAPSTAEQRAARVAAAMKTPTSIGAAMLVADMYGADRSDAFKAYDKPVLVIAAAASEERAAQAALATSVKRGKLVVVENAGHAVFLDQPRAFNAALRTFLDGLAAPAG